MFSSIIHLPSFIYLYQGARTKSLELEKIARYLKSWFQQVKIVVREDFFFHYFSHLSPEKKDSTVNEIARKLAASTMPTGRKTSSRLN